MKHRYKFLSYSAFLVGVLLFAGGCKDEEYAVPIAKDVLQNDVIKRTLGPNIVGNEIEFAYAMGIIPEKGSLASAEVEASIAGATGTYLDNNFYSANPSNGSDLGVVVATPSVTNATKTSVTFNSNIQAATLRFHYKIPEEARGKAVTFTFSVKSSNGESVSYKMGPYTIAKMAITRNLNVSDGNMAYVSIADMAVYNATDAAAKAANIDLVYLYRNTPTSSAFNHALVAPASSTYLEGVTLPAGVNNDTKIIKTYNMEDRQLSDLGNTVFIDDLDFEKIDFSTAPNYAINLKAEAGSWVETADGKYRAYIYINSVNATGSAVISMKRYTMK